MTWVLASHWVSLDAELGGELGVVLPPRHQLREARILILDTGAARHQLGEREGGPGTRVEAEAGEVQGGVGAARAVIILLSISSSSSLS